MIKNLLLVAIAVIFLVSCGNQQNTADNADVKDELTESVSVTPDGFYDKAHELVDKSISIEGTIMHICSHGGKKMFIFGEDSDISVKLIPGDGMAAFNTEWEGSDIIAEGVVSEFRVDEEYLAEKTAKIEERIAEGEAMNDEEKKAAHACGELLDDATIQEELDQIDSFRAEIAESDDDHLSYYSVICSKYEVVEPAESDVDKAEDHEGHDHDGEDHEGHDHDGDDHEGHDHD